MSNKFRLFTKAVIFMWPWNLSNIVRLLRTNYRSKFEILFQCVKITLLSFLTKSWQKLINLPVLDKLMTVTTLLNNKQFFRRGLKKIIAITWYCLSWKTCSLVDWFSSGWNSNTEIESLPFETLTYCIRFQNKCLFLRHFTSIHFDDWIISKICTW